MNRHEVIDLLTCAAHYDHRKPSNADTDAWELTMRDITLADGRVAVVAHYMETSDWLMPAHVRLRVRAIRRRRLAAAPMPPPPRELDDDPAGYLEWCRRTRRAIADTPLRPEIASLRISGELEAGQ